MGRAIILRSDEWQSSFCSSLCSDFTTGVFLIATTAEASFTTSAAAATIVISSNRNAAAMRPSSRSAGMGGLRRVPDAVVEPAAPTDEPPATLETAAQDRSVVAEPASAAEQPKPPLRTDKIELTIDSLQNYELLKPIRVLVEPLGDKVFVAEAPDLNVSTSGTSVGGALILLKDHISTIYEGYTSKQNLDSERARHFKTFETYIGRPRRNWR